MGGLKAKKKAKDPFTEMAKAFGLGRPTGLDLPSESDGRIADRAWKRAYWKATKDFYCAKAKDRVPRGGAPGSAAGGLPAATSVEGELRRRLCLPRG